MSYRIALLLAILIPTQTWAIDFRESPAIAEVFNKAKVTGTFVLYDVNKKQLIGHDRKRAEKRFTPASTFKIPNSLIGLHTGAVSSVDEVFYLHDKKPKMLKSWEQDMGLKEAINTSNVNAFQALANRIGLKSMQDNVSLLNFGSGDIGKSVETFWLDGTLKISAVEQTIFLAHLAQGELPYSAKIQTDVREIIKLDEGSDWMLYGKTGWASKDQPGVGWFVGWVEQSGKIYSFAMNIDIPQDTTPPALPTSLSKRIEVTRTSLQALGLLHTGKREIERINVPNSEVPVSQAVIVPPNASTIYLSGMLPEINNTFAPAHSLEAFGDTETQTISVLRRIEAALARQDLKMEDVIQLKVFLVGDPSQNGILDFNGFQAGYSKFFSTSEQPNKPVRSVVQIAGLAVPGALIEIEATAAKIR